jgi:DNA-binding transcriptional MerR regulator
MKVMDDAADLLTTAGAAKILDRTPDTVRLWERMGKLHAIRTVSGQRLFRRGDVEAARERERIERQRRGW